MNSQHNIKQIKSDFPIFTTHPDLVYLDSAATSQKPQAVIDAVTHFYTHTNANIHRGIYDLSNMATEVYENIREKVAKFIQARQASEIIFTANASAGINYVAYGWARKFLRKGDIVVLSEMEHHSNIVPWLRLKEEIGIKIHYLPITKDYRLDYKALTPSPLRGEGGGDIDLKRIKLVALTHASNVLGTINPIAEIISFLKSRGVKAKFLVDAAQSVPHLPVDVQELDCDFLVFSSHKMFGSSGVGVLWARSQLLKQMDPFLVGSHMIASVSKEKASWQDIPHKFETGTGALEGVAGLGAAIDYLEKIGMENIVAYEQELTEYALQKLQAIPKIKTFGSNNSSDRLAVFSFAIGDIHSHDVAEVLNRQQIAIRSGHHCAQPLMQCLGVSGTARASFYIYNTKEDVNKLIEGIQEVKKIFKIS